MPKHSPKHSPRHSINRRLPFVALLTLAMSAGLVQADNKDSGGGGASSNIEVFLTVKPQDPQGKKKDQAPDIEATILLAAISRSASGSTIR